jgi:hypothetical protein
MQIKEKIVPLKVWFASLSNCCTSADCFWASCIFILTWIEFMYSNSSDSLCMVNLQIDLRVNNTVIRDQFLWVCMCVFVVSRSPHVQMICF